LLRAKAFKTPLAPSPNPLLPPSEKGKAAGGKRPLLSPVPFNGDGEVVGGLPVPEPPAFRLRGADGTAPACPLKRSLLSPLPFDGDGEVAGCLFRSCRPYAGSDDGTVPRT